MTLKSLPLQSFSQEVLAMVGESKKTIFANWLAAYGTHLEQVARGTSTDADVEIGDVAQERDDEQGTPKKQNY